jgi:ssDNA-binding Zn-finger/Zn-ribbon topoisomerase 1
MNRQKLDIQGAPCPRCYKPMTVFEHGEMTEKLLRQPDYYSRWYRCDNPNCKTKQVMPQEFKVRTGATKKEAVIDDASLDFGFPV